MYERVDLSQKSEADMQGEAGHGRVSRPRLLDALFEAPRTAFEATRGIVQWLPLVAAAPRGEPHTVFVMPGFLAGDASTLPLRRVLGLLGYRAIPWRQGVNTGEPAQFARAVEAFTQLAEREAAPISLIGQSLGGVYAREIAKLQAHQVRCVITLGSPYAAIGDSSVNPFVAALFERLAGHDVAELRRLLNAEQISRLSVPATSVYSKSDGVVSWQVCIEPETAISENVQVLGSHAGMAVNPDVLRIIFDRLAQNPAQWQKFDRNRCGRYLLYPAH